MSIFAHVPSNLDFNTLAQQYPYSNLPAGKKNADYLYYFSGVLVDRRARYKGEHPEYGDYFPLCSSRLRDIHDNYNLYMDYLVLAQVVETDSRFIAGEKCLGYKFTDNYSGQLYRTQEIDNYMLSNKVKQHRINYENEAKQRLRRYGYLTKWYFCGGLSIDKPAALVWVDQYKNSQLEAIKSSASSPAVRDMKSKAIIDTCEDWKVMVGRIHAGQLRYTDFTVDDFAGRFHGILTYTKKELRDFMSFRGQQLVSVDIKNCQPYLSTVFLEPAFWAANSLEGSTLIQLRKIKPDIYKQFVTRPSFCSTINIIRPSPETLASPASSADHFKKLVIDGQFYEYFQLELERAAPGQYNTRDKVKKAVLTLLNGKNRDQLKYVHLPSELFSRLFPEMYKVLYFIRASDNSNLGAILQRIESHLVLDIICRKITAINPEIPLFTIHDCIVTTVGNEEIVKQIVEEVLTEKIGAPPAVKYEYWRI